MVAAESVPLREGLLVRRVIAYGLVVLCMAPLVLGLVWMLYKADPPGYTRPSDFTTAEIETEAARFVTASGLVAATLADERNRTPLDVTFTDAMINGHLRTHARDVKSRLPGWITNPQVVFTAEDIVLMAQIRHEKADTILSVHVRPTLTDDKRIALRIIEQKAGRLPLPDAVRNAMADHAEGTVRTLAARLQALDPAGDRRRYERLSMEMEFLRDAAQLCRGQEVTVDTRKYNLRIDGLELSPRRLHLVGSRVTGSEGAIDP